MPRAKYRCATALTWVRRSVSPITTIYLLLLVACAQTTVRPVAQTDDRQLPRPTRIMVDNFAINAKDVIEYQGIMRQQPSNPNPLERQRATRLRQLGFIVEAAEHGKAVGEHELLIDGRLSRVDEGNPLRRWVVGFGAGAAQMTTRVRAFYGSNGRKVLEFITQAGSGQLPGVAATAPAGAAASLSIGIGIAASSAVTKGIQEDLTSAEQLALASAEQAVRFLSEFFARQGWIDPRQARKARMATQ
jgi:hypothetical protein